MEQSPKGHFYNLGSFPHRRATPKFHWQMYKFIIPRDKLLGQGVQRDTYTSKVKTDTD